MCDNATGMLLHQAGRGIESCRLLGLWLEGDCCHSSLHHGSWQHSGRWSVVARPDTPYGVGDQFQSPWDWVLTMRISLDWCFCNISHLYISSVVPPYQDLHGLHQCHDGPGLDANGVCQITIQDDPSSVTKRRQFHANNKILLAPFNMGAAWALEFLQPTVRHHSFNWCIFLMGEPESWENHHSNLCKWSLEGLGNNLEYSERVSEQINSSLRPSSTSVTQVSLLAFSSGTEGVRA